MMQPKHCILKRYFRKFARVTQLSIFIARCRLCRNDLVFEGEDIICSECKKKISMFTSHTCRHCDRPLGNLSDLCGECLVNPPPFRKHISYGRYEEELKDLILKYKYGGVKKLKNLLASYYLEVIKKKINESFHFIIPIPPDKGRKREFNPVLTTANILSKQLGIKLLSDHLVKVKKTLPQAGLTRNKRLNNLNCAFVLTDAHPCINAKKILLIDDVYTTGTTVKKCTELLVKEDADVVALTLARSI